MTTAEHPEEPPAEFTREDIRRALAKVEAEAAEHYGDYAAGERNARRIIEEALLS